MKRIVLSVAFVAALAGSIFTTWMLKRAEASRNGSGTYSLPAGQPVVSGTTISSSVFNTLTTDLATEMTDSLSRSGKGGMKSSAQLKLDVGSVSAPSLAFVAETNSGLYRNGSHDVRFSLNGSDAQTWGASGSTFTGTLGVTGAATLSSTLGITGLTTATGGAKIGGSGTTITASYGASYTVNFGTGYSGIGTSTQTLNGAAVGGVCIVSPDASLGTPNIPALYCAVTAPNTVVIFAVASTTTTLNGVSVRVRVFQP